ncbi:dirigent protein 22-like [Coffea arabica]|uniref:Dirigent protein n=1 Tax=Coffea arabica TaxID=13443 RepID=A0A6P6VN29_COFAR|nr:dirigent protein 22-like [Coffea arabica]
MDVHGVAQGHEGVDEWFHKLDRTKEKVTRLHFYFHDTVSGKSPTAVTAAGAKLASPTMFGLINTADDPMTVGPELNSTLLGRAQGIYASADQNEVGLAMYMNYYFTAGKYRGSTLSLLGRNAGLHSIREMSIVGGTGVFRLARGIATAKTYFVNATTADDIVEYNVVVVHY